MTELRALALIAGLLAGTACSGADAEVRSGPRAETEASAADAATPMAGAPTSGEAPAGPAAPPAGYAWVIFGADTVVAEVAATPEERSRGLMYRDDVPDGTGMLFVFQRADVQSFWMANTYVPLDIAYMDASYRIIDILQMEPLDTGSYPSSAPALFALEVRQGWFAEQEIVEGAQAEIVFGIQPRR